MKHSFLSRIRLASRKASRMHYASPLVLSAAMLGVVNPARAATVTFVPTPFAGLDSNYPDLYIGTAYTPYTDPYGRTIDSTYGGQLFAYGFGVAGDITFSNLAAGTTEVGVGFYSAYSANVTLTSVTFSNGDVYNATHPSPNSVSFFGFFDPTPFTSVTLTFASGAYAVVGDLDTSSPAILPEPGSLALLCGMAPIGGLALRRRRK